MKSALRTLCEKYRDVFRDTVRAEPADIPPYEFKVDEAKWHSNKNRGPPRPQSAPRQAAFTEQITLYLKLGVITACSAIYYSQIHMVAKKDPGKWRTTVDFRNLNDASEARHWAMPNIGETLRNIGRKAFKGTLDLTSGYHQAPLSKACQLYTAFICCLGIFCWTRLPMGLKGAAAYFQQILATIVLGGLIHVVCALYIDDCIVYGDSEEEFVSNLEKVLQAFQAKNISLNPAKCKLGLETIEYVGHTLSREGLHFTDDKLAGVRNFSKPTTAKRLKMFVGLANYFHAHVHNMAEKMHPLHAMLPNYTKATSNRTLQWSTDQEAAFERVKADVADCPALFFVDSESPIYVQTDASDYGIGAYIFQIVDGVEKPISFISKSLTKEQLKWSTPDKEAYAIFYTLKN